MAKVQKKTCFRTNSEELVRTNNIRINASVLNYTVDPHTGYYTFHDVKIARVGLFKWRANELAGDGIFDQLPNIRQNDIVYLNRPAENITPDVLKTFEGIDLTNDHPSGKNRMINSENFSQLAKGRTLHNAKFDGKWITNDILACAKEMIDAILSGKAEVSIGYLYRTPVKFEAANDKEYVAEEWITRNNHLAVVWKGRAGEECRINKDIEEIENMTMTVEKLDEATARLNVALEKLDEKSKFEVMQDSLKEILSNFSVRLNEVEKKFDEKEKEDKKEDPEKKLETKKEEAKEDDKSRNNDVFFNPIDVKSLLENVATPQLVGWMKGRDVKGGDKTTAIYDMVSGMVKARENREGIFNTGEVSAARQNSEAAANKSDFQSLFII